MKTLDELMAEYEPERLAEIAKDDTPEARRRSEQRRAAEIQKEIRQGLRTPDGEWRHFDEPDDDEPEEDEDDETDDAEGDEI